jgi:ABC-2 type transport system permease protein
MGKYATVFAVDWQNQFIYRLNFILWRVRNVLRLIMTYFLWTGVFSSNTIVFGYDRTLMTTYIFMVLVVQSLIISGPSADNIGGEIANGDISNFLLKPISYIKYWFTRDMSSKLLNVVFSFFEVGILYLLIQPKIFLHLSFQSLIGTMVLCILAVFLYYFINVTTRFVAFWAPENTWGLAFIVIVFTEILAGGIFPLDVLPNSFQLLLQFTPFPYLVYYPIAVFIGKIAGWELVRIVVQALLWTITMGLVAKFVWREGLKVHGAEGK